MTNGSERAEFEKPSAKRVREVAASVLASCWKADPLIREQRCRVAAEMLEQYAQLIAEKEKAEAEAEAVPFCRVEDVDDNASHARQLGVDLSSPLYLHPAPSTDRVTAQGGDSTVKDCSIVAGGWTGWACQYPNSLPRLYGALEIAELNHDHENGDRLIYLVESLRATPVDGEKA